MDVAGRLLFLVWKRIETLGAKYRFIWLQVRWHNEHRKPLRFLTMVFRLLSSDEVHWGGRWKASKRLGRHCKVFLFTWCNGVVQSLYWPDCRLYRGIVVWFQIGVRNFYLSQCLLAGSWPPPSLSVGTGGCSLRSEAAANVKLTGNMRLVPRHMLYLLTAVGLSPGGSTHLHTNNT
jgi:hypothetical protein